MLDRGAVPIIGICVFVGGFEKQDGHSARTAFRKRRPVEKVKLTLAEIIPATNVPWPSFAKFEQPRPSPTKSSQSDDRAVEADVREARADAGVDHGNDDALTCEATRVQSGDAVDLVVQDVRVRVNGGQSGKLRTPDCLGRLELNVVPEMPRVQPLPRTVRVARHLNLPGSPTLPVNASTVGLPSAQVKAIPKPNVAPGRPSRSAARARLRHDV